MRLNLLSIIAFVTIIATPLLSEGQITSDRPTIAPDARIAVERGGVQAEITSLGSQWGGWTIMQTVVKYGILNRLSTNVVFPGLLLLNNKVEITPITGIYFKAGLIQDREGIAISLVPFVGYDLWNKGVVWSITTPFRIVGSEKAYAAISPFYSLGILGTDLTTSFNWFGAISTFHEVSFRTSSDLKNNSMLFNLGIIIGVSKNIQLDGGVQLSILPSVGQVLPFIGFTVRFK